VRYQRIAGEDGHGNLIEIPGVVHDVDMGASGVEFWFSLNDGEKWDNNGNQNYRLQFEDTRSMRDIRSGMEFWDGDTTGGATRGNGRDVVDWNLSGRAPNRSELPRPERAGFAPPDPVEVAPPERAEAIHSSPQKRASFIPSRLRGSHRSKA
jgi:hypothetical protein